MINLGLENKKVIILGASNGIGKQLSYDFVNQGSKVSIVARNLKSLKKIASNLNSIKPGNNFFSSRITNPHQSQSEPVALSHPCPHQNTLSYEEMEFLYPLDQNAF